MSSRTPTASRSCRSRRTSRWSATTSPTSSTRPRTRSSTRVADDIQERYETGQPVLVGTISVEKSEQLVEPAQAARHPARGAQREAARARGARRHAGRPAVLGARSRRTWPVAASTSCSAATPRVSPATRCSPRASTPEDDAGALRRSCVAKHSRPSAGPRATSVRELGGLYVLGTERHESRRIDNQLRGRAGRQGDPGESRFYLSLEDDLMRLFATGAMSWVMDRAFPDDMPLEAKMVTKAIERAQRTVEDRNFEIRKDVLKYDEVMNEQRKVIYQRRQQILDGEDLARPGVRGDRGRGRSARSPRTARASSPRTGTSTSSTATSCHAPDRHRRSRSSRTPAHRPAPRAGRGRGARRVRGEGGGDRQGDAARDRAARDAVGDRPALARAPLRDGLPARGHQPPRDGPARPARRVAARGLRHVRGDDGADRGRLRALRDPPRGRRRGGAAARRGNVSTRRPRTRSRARAAPARRPRRARRPRSSPPSFDGRRRSGADRGRPRTSPTTPVRVEKTPGRNEPCYCGSGKKFKLCHGR